jgi:hypothetical protein
VTPDDVKRLDEYASGHFNPANPFSFEKGLLAAMAIGG